MYGPLNDKKAWKVLLPNPTWKPLQFSFLKITSHSPSPFMSLPGNYHVYVAYNHTYFYTLLGNLWIFNMYHSEYMTFIGINMVQSTF